MMLSTRIIDDTILGLHGLTVVFNVHDRYEKGSEARSALEKFAGLYSSFPPHRPYVLCRSSRDMI